MPGNTFFQGLRHATESLCNATEGAEGVLHAAGGELPATKFSAECRKNLAEWPNFEEATPLRHDVNLCGMLCDGRLIVNCVDQLIVTYNYYCVAR